MTDYEYDENLPYVLVAHGIVQARFRTWRDAEGFLDGLLISGYVIDTTPKPRVPDDAKYILWEDRNGEAGFARRSGNWWETPYQESKPLDDLHGVTPDTVFTVLEERKS